MTCFRKSHFKYGGQSRIFVVNPNHRLGSIEFALFAATVWARKEKTQPPTQPLADVEHALTVTSHPRDERSDWLYEQIGQLEPIDRSVCLLLLDGFSYKEMAGMLGISESNVGVKVHRIKQYLIERSKEVIQHEL